MHLLHPELFRSSRRMEAAEACTVGVLCSSRSEIPLSVTQLLYILPYLLNLITKILSRYVRKDDIKHTSKARKRHVQARARY